MDFLKRWLFYLFIILLIMSIYRDLSIEERNTTVLQSNTSYSTVDDSNYIIYKVKVQTGDTVLSIVEDLNEALTEEIALDKILADFQKLNPETDPHRLQIDHFYYFPVYKKNGD